MLSPRIYSGIQLFCINVATRLGVIPFSWNSRRQVFVKCRHARRLGICNLLLFLLWSVYLFFQIFRYHLSKNYKNLNLLVAFTTATLIALEVLFLPIAYEDGMLSMMNSILIYLRRIEDCYLRSNKQTKFRLKIVENLLDFQFISLLNIFLVECVFFLWYPNSPLILGNIVPFYWPLSIRIFLVYILPFHGAFIAYMNLYVYFSIGIIYGLLLMPFILRELNLGRKEYKSYSDLRTTTCLTLEYRTAQLLQQRFNGFMGCLLIPAQTLSGGLFVFASFAVIKHWNETKGPTTVLMILFAIISSGMWGLALHIGGYVYINGIKLVNSWKYRHFQNWNSKGEHLFILKFAKSARPLVVSFGKMFTIHKLTALEFFKGLARSLMRVLLTMETN